MAAVISCLCPGPKARRWLSLELRYTAHISRRRGGRPIILAELLDRYYLQNACSVHNSVTS